MDSLVASSLGRLPPAEIEDFRQSNIQRFLSSNRAILGLALVCSIIIPELFHDDIARLLPWFKPTATGWLKPQLLLVAASVIIGHLSLMRLGLLPLVTTRSLIVPTFAASFGSVVIVFQLLQIQPGRYHLWTGFIAAVGWYLLVAHLRGRYLRPSIGLIGPIDASQIALPQSVKKVVIAEPRLTGPVSAVLVEDETRLDLAWSKFITKLVLSGVPVYQASGFMEALTGRVRFKTDVDNDIGALLPSFAYGKTKRILDLLGCLILVLPFLVIIGIACLAIRIESRGPVIFRQVRRGYRGKPFVCLKLRTMRSDAQGSDFTLEDDPRITRVGKLLRQWRIDEMPQIINVIRGEMSWIGPRPEALRLARRYSASIAFYDYRHAVRPGITGWAAVHQGNVGDVDAAQLKLEYDFYYIRNFSPWLDFLIVIKTFRTVFSGFGSR